MISHTHEIRTCVQPVNVEIVGEICDSLYVADEGTIGKRLQAMRARSGLSLQRLAVLSGYKGASSIQRYFSDEYDPPFLPTDVAQSLAKGFEGTDVALRELVDLARFGPSDGRVIRYEGASAVRLNRDVPVYGTALGASRLIEGEAIEQTDLDQSNTIAYFVRPTVLQGRGDVYGIFIQGSSMAPRFEEGETAFVESKRPPRVGDDVVVHLRGEDEHEGERVRAVLIKRLIRRTSAYIELEQFNPPKTFRVDAELVKDVHRVIPWSELLS